MKWGVEELEEEGEEGGGEEGGGGRELIKEGQSFEEGHMADTIWPLLFLLVRTENKSNIFLALSSLVHYACELWSWGGRMERSPHDGLQDSPEARGGRV